VREKLNALLAWYGDVGKRYGASEEILCKALQWIDQLYARPHAWPRLRFGIGPDLGIDMYWCDDLEIQLHISDINYIYLNYGESGAVKNPDLKTVICYLDVFDN
jgi:hypothetical protein